VIVGDGAWIDGLGDQLKWRRGHTVVKQVGKQFPDLGSGELHAPPYFGWGPPWLRILLSAP